MNRLPTIVFYFAKTFINLDGSFIWLLVLAVLLWRLIARALAPSDILLLAPLLYLSVIALGYLFSDITPLTSHLASSGYRLVAQVTPLAVLWLGLQTIPRNTNSNQARVTHAPL